MRAHAEELKIVFDDIYKTDINDLVLPWDMPPVACDMSFREINKKQVPRGLVLHFLHLHHKYPYPTFYMDASRTTTSVSYAKRGVHFTGTRTLLNRNTSIFPADKHDILTTVKLIAQTMTTIHYLCRLSKRCHGLALMSTQQKHAAEQTDKGHACLCPKIDHYCVECLDTAMF